MTWLEFFVESHADTFLWMTHTTTIEETIKDNFISDGRNLRINCLAIKSESELANESVNEIKIRHQNLRGLLLNTG